MAYSTQALITDPKRNIGSDLYGNLPRGAQLGYGPRLVDLDCATPLVLPHVQPVVLSSPQFFKYLPGADDFLRALMERHAKSIDGIDLTYTVEVGTAPVGGDGQVVSMPTQTKREQPSPTFTFGEVVGNPIWNFFRHWIILMKNPDSQSSMTATVILDAIGEDTRVDPILVSTHSMDLLIIQYDTTFRHYNVLDGWIILAMFPTTSSAFGAKSEKGGPHSMPERSITFTGIVQHNFNTRQISRRVAATLMLHRIDYDFAPPVAENVDSRMADEGLHREVAMALADHFPIDA